MCLDNLVWINNTMSLGKVSDFWPLRTELVERVYNPNRVHHKFNSNKIIENTEFT